MQANKGRDTKPELALRRAVHALGLRYRVDHPLVLPGVRRRGDLVFTRARVAVFLDSCFWHSCPEHGTRPGTNADFWRTKIERNVERDTETNRLLREAGWIVIRVWEHEAPATVAPQVLTVVKGRNRSKGRE